MEEKIVFAITEEIIDSEASQEIGRELSAKEMERVIGEIESESDPIFDFIRECILKVTGKEPTKISHPGNLF